MLRYIAPVLAVLALILGGTWLANRSVSLQAQTTFAEYLPAECLQDTRLRQTVELDASALPVADVLKELSAQSHVPLSADQKPAASANSALLAVRSADGAPDAGQPFAVASGPVAPASKARVVGTDRRYHRRSQNALWLTASFRAEHRQMDIPPSTLRRWLESDDEFGLTVDIALEIARLPDARQRALLEWCIQEARRENTHAAKREALQQVQELLGAGTTAPLLRLIASLPAPARSRVLNGTPLSLRDLPAGSTPALMELVSTLSPQVQNLWFHTDAPFVLQVQRSVSTAWAVQEDSRLERTSSTPKRQATSAGSTLYRLRIEKLQASLRTPSGTLGLVERQLLRFTR